MTRPSVLPLGRAAFFVLASIATLTSGLAPGTGRAAQIARPDQFLAVDCAAVSDVSQIECEALVALYESTDGPNWTDNTGWLSDPNACSWHGVTCDGGNNVIELILSDNNLAGSLPPELGGLANLESLDLSLNRLTGEFPPELGNLTNLQNLDISGNALSGAVPVEILNLTNLAERFLFVTGAYFAYNALYAPNQAVDDFLDLKHGADWSQTQTIAPSNVNVTGTAPHSATLAWDPIEYTEDSGRYRVLHSTSQIGPWSDGGATASKTDSGLVVEGLAADTPYYFVVRTETDRHLVNENDVVSESGGEVSAVTLPAPPGIFITPISGLVTSEAGDSDSFEVVLDTQPAADVVLTLQSSDATEGTVSDSTLSFTAANWDLAQTVTVTGVDDAEPDGHRAYSIVTGLAVSSDPDYSGIDPPDVAVTNLDDEDFQTAALVALYNSTDGANWTDSSNWLVGDPCTNGWYGVGCDGAGSIVWISLSSNDLSGTIASELGTLSNLRELNLDHNQLTGTVPTWLGSSTRLQYLNLSSNQLDGKMPAELAELTNLRALALGDNQLTGPIPTWLGGLTNLVSLSLDGNRLTGEIPAELGNLINLNHLFLNSNALSGAVPVEILNLTNLEDYFLFSRGASLDYNALYAPNQAVDEFLDAKSSSGWSQTQTVAPANVTVSGVGPDSVTLSWDAIEFTAESGRYHVSYRAGPGGPLTGGGATADKLTTGLEVGGLAPGEYSFFLRTETDSHDNNANTVLSEYSAAVAVTVTAGELGINSFVVDPAETEEGGVATVSWVVSGAASCTALGTVDEWTSKSVNLPSGQAQITVNVPGCHIVALECTDGVADVAASQSIRVREFDVILSASFEDSDVCAE